MSLGRPTSAPHPNRAPLDKGLAENVLELRSTLTKYTQELDERAAEKKRLLAIQADFRRHLAWQKQRKQTLQRNHERLFNERTWLDGKSAEVGQDVTLLSNELRQCKAEVDKLKAERDAQAETLLIAREEAKLEISSLGSMQELCTQATKALSVHTVRARPRPPPPRRTHRAAHRAAAARPPTDPPAPPAARARRVQVAGREREAARGALQGPDRGARVPRQRAGGGGALTVYSLFVILRRANFPTALIDSSSDLLRIKRGIFAKYSLWPPS